MSSDEASEHAVVISSLLCGEELDSIVDETVELIVTEGTDHWIYITKKVPDVSEEAGKYTDQFVNESDVALQPKDATTANQHLVVHEVQVSKEIPKDLLCIDIAKSNILFEKPSPNESETNNVEADFFSMRAYCRDN